MEHESLTFNEKIEEDVEEEPSCFFEQFLFACDAVYASFVITPLVLVHWYGAWTLFDRYVDYFPPWQSACVGLLFHLLSALARSDLYKWAKFRDNSLTTSQRILRYIFVRLYLYVFGFTCILQWRSMFMLLDIYFGEFEIGLGW